MRIQGIKEGSKGKMELRFRTNMMEYGCRIMKDESRV
jgi:hypothetical protein